MASELHITTVLAMSADGKIADAHRSAARFSSAADLQHLEAEVAQADAVLTGSGTLRAYGTILSVRCPQLQRQRQQRGQPPQPLQIIWSPSGQLDPQLKFFRQPVPRALLTTPAGAAGWSPPAFEAIWSVPPPWDWSAALEHLRRHGIRRLALLGGGHLVAELLQAGYIDELVLTVCPLLLGGATAPTPVDGLGFAAEEAPALQLCSVRVLGDEVYLRYRRLQPPENLFTLENDCP